MEKITYREMAEMFREQEKANKGVAYHLQKHLHGAIVFTEDSFNKPYSLESRTYLVSSDNKAYKPGMAGYSIFGSASDGSDSGVRLEAYMAEERGGPNGWKVDYCYLTEAR